MSRYSSSRLVPLAFLASVLVLALGGCAAEDKDKYVERPVEELYNDAMNNLDSGNYQQSAKDFEEVERQHPYSVWATKAQLMTAYAQYQRNKFDEAIVSLDRFIQLHPSHRDTPYAYYLKGLCYYEQIADVARDQKLTEQALKSLQEVVDRFPNSKYARDAKLKVDLTRDHLAGKEMAIGRYYESRHQYLAAINRYRNVIENYQTTTHVPEALHRTIECYEALGLKDEANKVAAVLGHNFPGADWYADSYTMVTGKAPAPDGAREPGWFDWVW